MDKEILKQTHDISEYDHSFHVLSCEHETTPILFVRMSTPDTRLS